MMGDGLVLRFPVGLMAEEFESFCLSELRVPARKICTSIRYPSYLRVSELIKVRV